MFKVQLILIFTCLFILKVFVVEASSIPSTENGTQTEDIKGRDTKRPNTLPTENCGDALVGTSHEPYNSNSSIENLILSDILDQSLSILSKQNRLNIKLRNPNFSKDILLDRIHLMENQQDLEEQGYRPEYIATFDHVKNNLQLTHSLRQRFSDFSTNPKKAHIPEFARLIDPHIDFIERGIRSQNSPDKNLRLHRLTQLRYEMQFAQKAKQVTYKRWLDFNLQLAILATPQKQLSSYFYFALQGVKIGPDTSYNDVYRLTSKALSELLDQHKFPKVIMIPTIENSGSIGIISENRTYGVGIHFIGLSNGFTKAHHRELAPLLFFSHDIVHVTGSPLIDTLIDMSPFINLLLHKIQSLPKPQRERAELVFYELTHELGKRLSTITEPIQDIVDRHIDVSPEDYTKSGFLKFMPNRNPTYNDVKTFLQQTRVEFVELFTEVNREFLSALMDNH